MAPLQASFMIVMIAHVLMNPGKFHGQLEALFVVHQVFFQHITKYE